MTVGLPQNVYAMHDYDVIVGNYTSLQGDRLIVPEMTLATKQQALTDTEQQEQKEDQGEDVFENLRADAVKDITEGAENMKKSLRTHMMDDLQSKTDDAKAWLESLSSYRLHGDKNSTFSLDFGEGKVGMTGMNFENTVVNVANLIDANDAKGAAKALLADCIPCEQRILDLLNINIDDDLAAIAGNIIGFYENILLDIVNFVFGNHKAQIYADLCNLLKFLLEFGCVPDLVKIMAMFRQLLIKYSLSLDAVKVGFIELLKKIALPSLSPLAALLDRYLALIVAPFECIVDAIDMQLHKIYADNKYVDAAQAQVKKSVAALKGGLETMKDMMEEGVEWLNGKLDEVKKSLLDLIGIDENKMRAVLDFSVQIEKCALLIGIIQAVISLFFKKIDCGFGKKDPADKTQLGSQTDNMIEREQALSNAINTEIASPSDLDFVYDAEAGTVKLTQKLPANIAKIQEVIGRVVKENPELAAAGAARGTQTVVTPTGEIKPMTAIVPVRNCLYSVVDKDLASASEFIKTL